MENALLLRLLHFQPTFLLNEGMMLTEFESHFLPHTSQHLVYISALMVTELIIKIKGLIAHSHLIL